RAQSPGRRVHGGTSPDDAASDDQHVQFVRFEACQRVSTRGGRKRSRAHVVSQSFHSPSSPPSARRCTDSSKMPGTCHSEESIAAAPLAAKSTCSTYCSGEPRRT